MLLSSHSRNFDPLRDISSIPIAIGITGGLERCLDRAEAVGSLPAYIKSEGGISSVGLEHYLDRVGVVGSNPTCPTQAGWEFNRPHIFSLSVSGFLVE